MKWVKKVKFRPRNLLTSIIKNPCHKPSLLMYLWASR